MTRLFTFIGVTTGSSSIMAIFPRWRDCLGLGCDLEVAGWDLPIHAPPERYREAVMSIRADPNNLGGLVTTHKIDLYRAAYDLFDEIDDYARLCGEVSCLAKRDGRLLGWAKDPITAGRVLERMLGRDYFRRAGGSVLCFGAGGAGVAITVYLITRPDAADRPSHLVVTDRNAQRLAHMRAIHRKLGSDVPVEYVENADPLTHDRLMAELSPGSLVINATGMGKDLPGSPITDAGRFPEGGAAWELNYRGDLDFLRQALAQQEARRLRVEDGWQYFIFGWTAVMEEVFNRPISDEELEALSCEAAFARPSIPDVSRYRPEKGM
jgi:shikimate 5-dehydrogenase